jgi:hypothetical protein
MRVVERNARLTLCVAVLVVVCEGKADSPRSSDNPQHAAGAIVLLAMSGRKLAEVSHTDG